jgi:hypothetical protein
MEWKNPDGSVTRGVVIEDGSGNKVTSFSGGGGGASNASVGAVGAAAPTSATEIGFINALGNLAGVGAANPLPVTTTGNLATSDSGAAITGAAMPAGGSGVTGWLSAIWSKLAGTLSVSGAVSVSGPLPAFSTPPTVQTAPLAPVATAAAASNLALKGTAGSLVSLEVVAGATAGFVMVFDAVSAPADGAVAPKWVYPVAANGALNMAWGNPLSFSTGIVAVFSSTGPFTKTASATAFISGQVQ